MRLDLLIRNARIVTLDPQRPTASDVGVLGGVIVGLDEELSGLEAERVVDARSSAIVPGFNDVHCHTTWFGLNLKSIDLAGAASLGEVYARIAAAAETAEGQWLTAVGFDPEMYRPAELDRMELDAAARGRPLLIRHRSGHAAHANTEALARAGILRGDVEVPAGGTVVRNGEGNPTGLLEETAQSLVQELILPYSKQAIVDALDAATRVYAAQGITSFSEAGIGYGWIGHSPMELAAYLDASEADRLRARAQLMPTIESLHGISASERDDFRLGLDLGLRTGFGSDLVSIGPTKIFLDGAFAGETAALTEPYCTSSGNRGRLLGTPEELTQRIMDAYGSGWSIAAHAIGDAAVDLAIDAFTAAQRRYGRRRVPNRIEHAWLVRDDQLERIREGGIAVTPQSSFLGIRGGTYTEQLGERRLAHAFRARSFVEAGVLMPGSSDRPCADGSALGGMQAYVERLSSDGTVFGSADERLTNAQALAAYTSVAAEATGFGASKGRIKRGYLADLAVLEASPLEVPGDAIASIEVLATLLGGQLVHRSASSSIMW